MASEETARRSRLGIIIAAASALTLAINDVAVPFAYAQGFSAPTVVFFRFLFLLASLVALLPQDAVSDEEGSQVRPWCAVTGFQFGGIA